MSTLDIGQHIASRRRALRLTQAELAKRASVGRRTLIDLENGSGASDIGFRKLERILNILGQTFSITDNPRRPTEDELSRIFIDEDSI